MFLKTANTKTEYFNMDGRFLAQSPFHDAITILVTPIEAALVAVAEVAALQVGVDQSDVSMLSRDHLASQSQPTWRWTWTLASLE